MAEEKRSRKTGGDRVAVICTALRRAIIERALSPGDRLPEDSLGERFGVSRTIARSALGQLAAEGLVDLRRNRIAVVAVPSFEDARDIFDIRVDLERQVVRHLAGKLTEAQVKQLRAIVDAEHQARHGTEGISSVWRRNSMSAGEMTGKPVLIRYVTEICYRADCRLRFSAGPIRPNAR
ncbi:GntR family transcriptional regulator [Azospirillum baldaniorum]|uniref:GntR family transcriptional regulator n=1 Tax=Azospirillum baldaniorum TaxID=1064539 RepID=UPI003CCC6A74